MNFTLFLCTVLCVCCWCWTVCRIVLENRNETTGDKLLQSYQQFRWPHDIHFYLISTFTVNKLALTHARVAIFNRLSYFLCFSCIRVVPPTPPPFYEAPVRNSFHRLEVINTIIICLFFFFVVTSHNICAFVWLCISRTTKHPSPLLNQWETWWRLSALT